MKLKRILFVFSDPGGAKPLLSYIVLNKIRNYKIISDRTYDFYNDFGLNVDSYVPGEEDNIISSFQPEIVFTATSYSSKIELRFIKLANRLGIDSVSFIDHYTNYQKRFELGDELVYPRKVFVIDQRAYEIAESEGLTHNSNVEISGHYYHEYLHNWKPAISRSQLRKGIKISDRALLITFAVEPLSNVGGRQKFGFDEIDVWLDFISALSKTDIDLEYKIVVKFHPNQHVEYFKQVIEAGNSVDCIYAEDSHTNTLLYHSDLIIGICSSILIEANLFDKRILRYLPNAKMSDSLSGMSIGKKSRRHRLGQVRS